MAQTKQTKQNKQKKKFRLKGLLDRFKLNRRQKEPYKTSPVRVKLVISEEDDNLDELERAASHVDGIKRVRSSHASEDEVFEALNGSDRKEHFRFEPNSRYFTICVYALCFVLAATLIIVGITKMDVLKAGINHFISVISPFLFGLFIAFILNPLVEWVDTALFQKLFHFKRAALRKVFSLLLTYLVVLGLVTVLLIYVSPQIGASLLDLYNKSESFTTTLLEYVAKFEEKIPGLDAGYIEGKITEMVPEIFTYLTNLAPKLLSLSVSIAKFAFNTFLSVAISIYVLYDKRKLKVLSLRVAYSFMSLGKANSLSHTIGECASIFGSFVFGKSLDSLIIGMLCFIILTIFGFPYAILVSVIVGITNMIPYFGPFIGAIPGVLLYLCISPMDALAFGIVILALQQFDGWVLGPKILGDSTGLSPLWVIFAITVGGAYAGVIGMFLGVPVVAVCAYLADRFITGKLIKRRIDIS